MRKRRRPWVCARTCSENNHNPQTAGYAGKCCCQIVESSNFAPVKKGAGDRYSEITEHSSHGDSPLVNAIQQFWLKSRPEHSPKPDKRD